jgi:photosynthetic reaction center H subunit
MQTGAITSYFDVAQLTINGFWLFFAGLIVYLRREDKREGYPLVGDLPGDTTHGWFPLTPEPKTYLFADGSTITVPRSEREPTGGLKPTGPNSTYPQVPTGNPLVDAVGPAAYAQRHDVPDKDWEGHPRIVPLRVAQGWSIDSEEPDPRGYKVVGLDGVVAGTVREAWIDRVEPQVYYLEVSLAAGGRIILVPFRLAKLNATTKTISVRTLTAAQFADVPGLRNPNVVTLLEEDKISAYFAGGQLYATPERAEPVI